MQWNEAAHPRNPKGTAGGEFRSGKGGGKAPKTARHTRSGAAPARGTLSYNGRTGTGYGMRHGDARVKRLQQALNRLGIRDLHGKPLAVDGKLGPLTTSAIKAWQKRNGMKPTGAITAADLAKLTKGGHKKAHLVKRRTVKAPTRAVAAVTGR